MARVRLMAERLRFLELQLLLVERDRLRARLRHE
jgi:hypothetical protein